MIDIVRFFEIARRLPSAGERILEKTVAKVIRKFCIACGKRDPPLTRGSVRQASKFERAGADRMAAHITWRHVAGIDWREARSEQRNKSRLRPL